MTSRSSPACVPEPNIDALQCTRTSTDGGPWGHHQLIVSEQNNLSLSQYNGHQMSADPSFHTHQLQQGGHIGGEQAWGRTLKKRRPTRRGRGHQSSGIDISLDHPRLGCQRVGSSNSLSGDLRAFAEQDTTRKVNGAKIKRYSQHVPGEDLPGEDRPETSSTLRENTSPAGVEDR
ncbi:unnamed protein product, partial [Amoebophrya sp. A25]|eukprot:GSA25T00010081001.1